MAIISKHYYDEGASITQLTSTLKLFAFRIACRHCIIIRAVRSVGAAGEKRSASAWTCIEIYYIYGK